MNIALIVSAGRGTRINSSIPKQFIKINDKEMLCYTLEKFQENPNIDEIVVVTLNEYVDYVRAISYQWKINKLTNIVVGGETRQESVRNGLNSLKCKDNDIVLIHDGDRPFVNNKIIDDCIFSANTFGSGITAINQDDVLKNGVSNLGREAIYNGVIYSIQTPQAFRVGTIKKLHNRLKDIEVSDDASLFDLNNEVIHIVEGDMGNIKITTDADLEYFKKGY